MSSGKRTFLHKKDAAELKDLNKFLFTRFYIQGIKFTDFLSLSVKKRRRFSQFLSPQMDLKALYLIVQIDASLGHGFDRGNILFLCSI